MALFRYFQKFKDRDLISFKILDSDSDSRTTFSDSDSGSNFQYLLKSVIPILVPIPAKIGLIPESIPIPESESCITGCNMCIDWLGNLGWRADLWEIHLH